MHQFTNNETERLKNKYKYREVQPLASCSSWHIVKSNRTIKIIKMPLVCYEFKNMNSTYVKKRRKKIFLMVHDQSRHGKILNMQSINKGNHLHKSTLGQTVTLLE